jgi:hypothetical protein
VTVGGLILTAGVVIVPFSYVLGDVLGGAIPIRL